MPDSQNINTSVQATIGHKFSILGHKSSVWFKHHLPPPAAYSSFSLPLTSVMERIPNLGTEQAQEITQGEKRIKEMIIQLSSLSHCMAAQVLAGVRRARRGHFWSAYMQTQLGLRIWFHILLFQRHHQLVEFLPRSLFMGCFCLSQETSQTLQTTALTQPQEWCRGSNSLRQGCCRKKKDEIVPLNTEKGERWAQRALQRKHTGNPSSSSFEVVFSWGRERTLLQSCAREVQQKLNGSITRGVRKCLLNCAVVKIQEMRGVHHVQYLAFGAPLNDS